MPVTGMLYETGFTWCVDFVAMVVDQTIFISNICVCSPVTVMCQYMHFLNCGSFVSFCSLLRRVSIVSCTLQSTQLNSSYPIPIFSCRIVAVPRLLLLLLLLLHLTFSSYTLDPPDLSPVLSPPSCLPPPPSLIFLSAPPDTSLVPELNSGLAGLASSGLTSCSLPISFLTSSGSLLELGSNAASDTEAVSASVPDLAYSLGWASMLSRSSWALRWWFGWLVGGEVGRAVDGMVVL